MLAAPAPGTRRGEKPRYPFCFPAAEEAAPGALPLMRAGLKIKLRGGGFAPSRDGGSRQPGRRPVPRSAGLPSAPRPPGRWGGRRRGTEGRERPSPSSPPPLCPPGWPAPPRHPPGRRDPLPTSFPPRRRRLREPLRQVAGPVPSLPPPPRGSGAPPAPSRPLPPGAFPQRRAPSGAERRGAERRLPQVAPAVAAAAAAAGVPLLLSSAPLRSAPGGGGALWPSHRPSAGGSAGRGRGLGLGRPSAQAYRCTLWGVTPFFSSFTAVCVYFLRKTLFFSLVFVFIRGVPTLRAAQELPAAHLRDGWATPGLGWEVSGCSGGTWAAPRAPDTLCPRRLGPQRGRSLLGGSLAMGWAPGVPPAIAGHKLRELCGPSPMLPGQADMWI